MHKSFGNYRTSLTLFADLTFLVTGQKTLRCTQSQQTTWKTDVHLHRSLKIIQHPHKMELILNSSPNSKQNN